MYVINTLKQNVKQILYRPGHTMGAVVKLKLTEFLDNRHMKVTMLSALRTGRLYLPGSQSRH